MKKFIFNPIFTLALLGLGFTACEDDKLDEKAKTVDVTITVTLPDAYEKVPLANLPKDSIKVTIGDQTLYTDTAGSVSATVEEGAYQLSATLRKVVEGLHNDGRNGLFVFDFLGTKAIAFSNETTTATINLLVSGEPEFSGYGEIAYVGDDTIHLKYKGDTINLAPLFTAQLKEGDIRTLTYSYEIVSQPQKRETGGNGTGLWTPVYDGYAAYDIAEESKLVAIDSLIAAFDLTAVTGKKREVSPAIVRAKLFADGDFIAQKDVPVLQDSISTQLVGIAPAEGIAFNVGERVTPGTNIFTVATPYAGNGLGVSLAGQFSGYFTDT
ncbi:MAG: hypothetical protein LBO71_00365, partial [Prevotellaceae bacterium]|nr:hypothetical protein [Prevotellaceae bacterium]